MLNFLVIGDWGFLGRPQQHAVAAGMTHVTATLGARFVVTTGDNFYDDGVTGIDDSHWQQSFETVYRTSSLQIPWFPVLGNHDHRGDIAAQIAYSQRSARWTLPAPFHSVRAGTDDGASVDLIFLDTSPFLTRYRVDGVEPIPGLFDARPEAQRRWLQRTLADSDGDWCLVLGHHPVFSASPFHGDTAELIRDVLPLLRGRAQAYIGGHEHDLQHLRDGGIEFLVCGAGGDVRATGRDARTIFSASCAGFASVGLSVERLTLRLHGADGAMLHEAHVRRAPVARAGLSRRRLRRSGITGGAVRDQRSLTGSLNSSGTGGFAPTSAVATAM